MKLRNLGSAAVAAVVALSVMACDGNYGPKQTGGAVLGGAAGGLLGAQIGGGSGQLAATAAGALLGVFLGSEVGKSLDRADRLYAQRTTQTALETQPSGTTSTWNNPDSGHSGTVTPTKTYKAESGHYCREYQQTVTIDGKTETAHGTACREEDGTWRIAN